MTSTLAVETAQLAQWLGDGVEVVGPEADQPAMTRAQLLAAVAGADALICLLTDLIDDELLAHAPRLKVIANHAVGVDNVDRAAATRRKIVVTNTPDVLTFATADLTLALLLAVARRLPEGDALVRSGEWRGWEPGQLLGAEVWGRTVGLVGFGRIGRSVARRARGFDMRVIYAAPHRAPAAVESALQATHVPLDRLLAEADFVSIHCPLTDATRGIIGRRELAAMKPGAILINTARGACVDEKAVCDALASGRLAGVGLDVFDREPEVTACLLAHPRALLTPHIGSATHTARGRMAELCARAVHAVLAGERPPHVVNPEVFG